MGVVVTLPKDSIEIGVEDIPQVCQLLSRKKSGVYVFFDNECTPLYVGKSSQLLKRLRDHLRGATHTAEFSKLFRKVRVYFESNPFYVEIYETYLINKLRPIFNVSKAFHSDSIASLDFGIHDLEEAIVELREERSEIIHALCEVEDEIDDDIEFVELGQHLAAIRRLKDIETKIQGLNARLGALKGRRSASA